MILRQKEDFALEFLKNHYSIVIFMNLSTSRSTKRIMLTNAPVNVTLPILCLAAIHIHSFFIYNSRVFVKSLVLGTFNLFNYKIKIIGGIKLFRREQRQMNSMNSITV